MMNSEMEIQCAQEIRELARQYCDGEFNKIMPPAIKWVVGNWCLQPPAKALGPQAASRALVSSPLPSKICAGGSAFHSWKRNVL